MVKKRGREKKGRSATWKEEGKTSIYTTRRLRQMLMERLREEGEGAEESSSRSGIINRDLIRLYELYEKALPTVYLTTKEAQVVARALHRGFRSTTNKIDTYAAISMMWGAVAREGRKKASGLTPTEADTLNRKIAGLTHLQSLAVLDACERMAIAGGSPDVGDHVRLYFALDIE